jgi:hypothetical protein
VWALKVNAAFRYARIEHTLDAASPQEHMAVDVQLGLDILLDMVEEGLSSKVVPAGGPALTPRKVMDAFYASFGFSNESMHSLLRSGLNELKMTHGEGVGAYMQRGAELFNQLMSSGGQMSESEYLQHLKEGVDEKFHFTVKLWEISSNKTAAGLLGALLAEECRLAKLKKVQPPPASMAMTVESSLDANPCSKENLLMNMLMVMTGQGKQQPWIPRGRPGGGGKNGQRRDKKPTICYNCGVAGHRWSDCPQPPVHPWRFLPARAARQPPQDAGAGMQA